MWRRWPSQVEELTSLTRKWCLWRPQLVFYPSLPSLQPWYIVEGSGQVLVIHTPMQCLVTGICLYLTPPPPTYFQQTPHWFCFMPLAEATSHCLGSRPISLTCLVGSHIIEPQVTFLDPTKRDITRLVVSYYFPSLSYFMLLFSMKTPSPKSLSKLWPLNKPCLKSTLSKKPFQILAPYDILSVDSPLLFLPLFWSLSDHPSNYNTFVLVPQT